MALLNSDQTATEGGLVVKVKHISKRLLPPNTAAGSAVSVYVASKKPCKHSWHRVNLVHHHEERLEQPARQTRVLREEWVGGRGEGRLPSASDIRQP